MMHARRQLGRLLLPFALGGALAACASTSVVDAWRWPSHAARPYQKVLVVGIANRPSAVETFERTMASELQKRGVVTAIGSEVLPPNAKDMPPEELKAFVADQGFDSALTMQVVRVDVAAMSKRANYNVLTYQSFYSFFGSAGGWVPMRADSTEKTIVQLEAAFHDLLFDRAVWTARTETTNPERVSVVAKDYSRAVVKRLMKDDVLKQN